MCRFENNTPKWANKLSKWPLEANLIHLGYIAKDAKQEGAFRAYDKAVKKLVELQNEYQDTPIRTLKVSIISNSTKIIRDYMENLVEMGG